MAPMPSLFISHGPPNILLADDPAAAFLRGLLSGFSKPRAIICVSAHYEAWRPMVTSSEMPETIHDFGGPPELFARSYPAPGSRKLAVEAVDLLTKAGLDAALDPKRGLDHGAWIPLMMARPEADIPVIQIAVLTEADPETHLKMGSALSILKEKGVIILGSGGAVHNLDDMDFNNPNGPPRLYAQAFQAWLIENVVSGNVDALLDYQHKAPYPEKSHPYPAEHFLPFFVALGAAGHPSGKTLFQGFLYGSLSMAAFVWDID